MFVPARVPPILDDGDDDDELSPVAEMAWYVVAGVSYIAAGSTHKVLLTWLVGPVWVVATLWLGPPLADAVLGTVRESTPETIVSWAAHQFEVYLVHAHLPRRMRGGVSFWAVAAGDFLPDFLSKFWVYGVTIGGTHYGASVPHQWLRLAGHGGHAHRRLRPGRRGAGLAVAAQSR